MLCVLILGAIGDRFSQLLLVLTSLITLVGAMLLLIAVPAFGSMVAAFVLYGAGYSVLKLVPYNQIRRICGKDEARYNRCLSMPSFFSFMCCSVGSWSTSSVRMLLDLDWAGWG